MSRFVQQDTVKKNAVAEASLLMIHCLFKVCTWIWHWLIEQLLAVKCKYHNK